MTEPHIRPATAADLPRVRELLVETWHATYDNIYGVERVTEITDDWHSLANLAVQMRSPGVVFLVTQTTAGIDATSLARAKGRGLVMLDRLYVRPEAHGRGLGTALLRETLDRFEHATVTRLEVEPQNTGAIAFYIRHGFVKVGETAECGNASSIVAHVMERPEVPRRMSR